ncbi:MAG: DegT/DnrJ/EryC1/StrS family aminotransferase [Verrucomicrobia bacterium]|nr:MAG: DegT/DnrJ/EryC1/StrS family aminotransferase [Verrucomicrobiota bacterium]
MNAIPQVEPWLSGTEAEALARYLAGGGWLTEFRQTRAFEEAIARAAGVPHAVCVTSGTVALCLALQAAGIGPGDRVLVPDYTMIATINAVLWCGAEPVLCDIDPETLCADLRSLTPPPGCRALMYVEINGRAGDLDGALEFCRRHGLVLIEDAAQAMGSRHRGRPLGGFGRAGIYSFTPHKIITTGQGGAVVTADAGLAARVRQLKDFHRTAPGIDEHDGIGYNFKFTDLQAVVGLEQIRRLEERIERKKAVYRRYQEGLDGLEPVRLIPTDLEQNAPWFVEILLPDRATRDALQEHLRARGIGSRPFYPPIHTQPSHRQYAVAPLPVSADIAPRGLWLPSSMGLTDEQIDRVCRAVREFFAG